MHVHQILSTKGSFVATVAPDASVATAVEALRSHKCGALVVSPDGHRIGGIVSERDIVRHLAEHGPEVLTHTVGAIMTTDVTRCDPHDTIEQLMAMMTDKRIRHVPVAQGDELVGIVSIGDVVKFRLSQLEDENKQLFDYLTTGR
jgi:CBS domain-containing protein